jgi:NAD(P)-dependent dehydrogenase (short-subunit alcohol dehydrogenase family)
MAEQDRSGQVALVTGGGSGIGASLCARLATRGYEVIVADVDEAAARHVAAEIGGDPQHLDVANRGAWREAVAAIIARHGRLDAVALNAGVMTPPRGESIGDDPLRWMDERYDIVRSVNLDGVAYGILEVSRRMDTAPGGRIAVTASVAGLTPYDPDPAYTMTKHGVIGLVRAIASSLAERNISIGALCPGGVDTPLVAPDVRKIVRTFASPDEVASDIDAVLDMSIDETGGIWISRDGNPLWRYTFAPTKQAPS